MSTWKVSVYGDCLPLSHLSHHRRLDSPAPKYNQSWCPDEHVGSIVYGDYPPPDALLALSQHCWQPVPARAACTIYTRKVFFLGQYHAGSAVNPLMSPILCPSLFSKMPSILQLLHRNAITCTKTEGDAAITNTPRNHSKVWQLSPRSRSIFKRSGFFLCTPATLFKKNYTTVNRTEKRNCVTVWMVG